MCDRAYHMVIKITVTDDTHLPVSAVSVLRLASLRLSGGSPSLHRPSRWSPAALEAAPPSLGRCRPVAASISQSSRRPMVLPSSK